MVFKSWKVFYDFVFNIDQIIVLQLKEFTVQKQTDSLLI